MQVKQSKGNEYLDIKHRMRYKVLVERESYYFFYLSHRHTTKPKPRCPKSQKLSEGAKLQHLHLKPDQANNGNLQDYCILNAMSSASHWERMLLAALIVLSMF
jgi:hypothetical protein